MLDWHSCQICYPLEIKILLLLLLFRIALWPIVGKELAPWLFACAVFILVPSYM